MTAQLPLGLTLQDSATFAGYFPGPNAEALRSVQSVCGGGESLVYLCGSPGRGKTHLLQAACHQAGEQGQAAAYLPLAQAGQFPLAVLEGLEALPLICLDDIHAIAGRREWEEALFDLFNRVRESQGSLIISALRRPAELGLELADLRSRLGWGLVLHLQDLDDAGKVAALRLRAARRGLELSGEAAHYLLSHCPRDMAALMGLLDALDHISLAAQRRLTIPFIREALVAHRPGNAHRGSPPGRA